MIYHHSHWSASRSELLEQPLIYFRVFAWTCPELFSIITVNIRLLYFRLLGFGPLRQPGIFHKYLIQVHVLEIMCVPTAHPWATLSYSACGDRGGLGRRDHTALSSQPRSKGPCSGLTGAKAKARLA